MEQIILDKVLFSLNNKRDTPLLVAIHAPQGCGKVQHVPIFKIFYIIEVMTA